MGYDGYSMSYRARGAYERGLLPAGKMVDFLKKEYPKSFRGLTTAIFTDVIGCGNEWHHTSCKFNKTQFYSVGTVFDYRHELKQALASIRFEKEAKKELAAAGISFILSEGKVWVGVSSFNPENAEQLAAARETLAMDRAEYDRIVENFKNEMKKLAAERNSR